MADDDLNLVERFQQGDVTAFDLLVSKYYSKIYDIVYRYTRDVENAYDLSQEVFEKAFKSLGRFKKRSSFYTWLYKIAVNACIDYGRKKSRFQSIAIDDLPPSHDLIKAENSYSPDKVVELKELASQINRAIEQLPPKQRAVFIMKRQEGLSLQEIAEVLGRSVGTIKAHLSHATHKLMDSLGPYLEK